MFPRKRAARLRLQLVVMLSATAAVLFVVWNQGLHAARLTDNERRLISAMTTRATASAAQSRRVRVAIFHAQIPGFDPTGGLGEVLRHDPRCSWASVGPLEIEAGELKDYDVILFPGGGGKQQSAVLGATGRAAVTEFVRSGGGYVGICAGAFLATTDNDWSLGLINAKAATGSRIVEGVGRLDVGSRGWGMVKVDLTDVGMQVFTGLPRRMEVDYSGGPVLSPAGREDLPRCIPLALFRTEVCKYEFQIGKMVGTPAILAAEFGKGRVIVFSPHPESSVGVESLIAGAVMSTARRPEGRAARD